METPTDLINVNEATKLLGVSHTKMAKLIKAGVLTVYKSPLDTRKKLVSKAELLSIKPIRAEAA
jgi:hypothetical protein